MSTSEWQDILENALTGVFHGIKSVEIIQAGSGSREYPGLERYTGSMKKMRLEELLIDTDAERMLIVRHAYDDVFAVVRYGDGAHAADLSKLIRIVFSQKTGDSLANNKSYVSMHDLRMNLRRWERSIALVFGERYASKLLAAAMAGRDPGAMSSENISDIRAFLSASIGECLIFEPEKVDK
jgi:hypothetical protein